MALLSLFIGGTSFAQSSLPTVTIAAGTGNEGGNVAFVVTLSEAVSQDVTFEYTTSIETADDAESTDFTAASGTAATIATNDTMVTINIATSGDTIDEPDETFTVTLSNVAPSNVATLGTSSSAQGTISDQTPTPSVSISDGMPPTVAENASNRTMNFIISLTGGGSELEPYVTWGVGGTADISDISYPLVSIAERKITFAAGETEKTFPIGIKNDRFYEHGENETVVVTVLTGSRPNIRRSAKTEGRGEIVDDDSPPTVSLTSKQKSFAEGSEIPLKLTSSHPSDTPVEVKVTVTGQDGASEDDYELHKSTLNLPDYSTDTTHTRVITLANQEAYEGPEKIRVTISELTPAGVAHFGTSILDLNITDSVDPPKISIADASAEEGDTMTFTITSSEVSATDTTVTYYTTAGTASTTEYGHIASDAVTATSATIDAGETTVDIDITTSEDALAEVNETFTVTLHAITRALEGITIDSTKKTATGTITDDDGSSTPTLSIAGPAAAVTEGSSMTFSLSLSGTSGAAVSVPFTLSGSAEPKKDFTVPTSPVTIAAGSTSGSITVSTTNDVLFEGDETILVTLGTPTNANRSATAFSATGTISDDETVPKLSIRDVSVDEGDRAELIITSDTRSQFDILGTWSTASGTAIVNKDYTPVTNGSFRLDATSLQETIRVLTIEDQIYEGNEDLFVTIVSSDITKATVSDASARVTINEDESMPSFALEADVSANEGDDMAFKVLMSPAADIETSFTYTTVLTGTGTADAEASDFGHVTSATTVNIAAKGTSASISIPTAEDLLFENNETFRLQLANPSLGSLGTKSSATGTIKNDDVPPTATLSAAKTTITEGNDSTDGTDVSLTVDLDAMSGVDATVEFSIDADGTDATQGTDYILPDSSNVTVSAGSTSKSFTIEILGDDIYEDDENIEIAIAAATNGNVQIGTTDSVTLLIDEDEAVPELSIADVTVAESAGNAELTVTSATKSAVDITFSYATSESTATSADFNHSSTPSGLTLTASSLSKSFNIGIKEDDIDEAATETFDVNLTNLAPSGKARWATGGDSATVTINDNDAIPELSIAGGSVDEGETVELDVSLTRASYKDIVFSWKTTDGTATASGSDYTAQATAKSETIDAGEKSFTISINTTADTVSEANETFTVTIATSSTFATLGTSTATVKINDDDGIPVVSVADAANLTEGDSGDSAQTLSFPVTLNQASSSIVSVPFRIDEATDAEATSDYVLATPSPISIAVGDTTTNINFTISGDDVYEGNEMIAIDLGKPTNATRHSTDKSATGTIVDNESKPLVSMRGVTVSEGDTATVEVTVNPTAEEDLSIETGFHTAGVNRASPQTDYMGWVSNPYTFKQGVTSYSFDIETVEDTIHEPNETFAFQVYQVSGPFAASGHVRNVTITIRDDDPIPTASISAASADEGEPIKFPVSLTNPSSRDITLKYATDDSSDNTAYTASSSDFTAAGASSSVTLKAGETASTISVATTEDSLIESDETFGIYFIQPPSHVQISSTKTTGTIVDDEEEDVPTVAVMNASAVIEGDDPATTKNMDFSVVLSEESTRTVTVPYTLGGTATSSDDYVSHGASPSLSIASGSTSATITVAIKGDVDTEESETVTVTLGVPTNATIKTGGGTASGSITDNDPVPEVEVANANTVVEGDDSTQTKDMNFAVSLSANAKKAVTVPYTLGGSATAGTDFIAHASDASVTIATGDNSATITVKVKGDVDTETAETITVTLSSPTNATVKSGGGTASGSITDNDPVPEVEVADAPAVVEGDDTTSTKNMNFAVTLSAAAKKAVSVPYTLGGTATSGTDFIAHASDASVTIAVGDNSTTITVAINGDTDVEATETVTVTLGSPTNATVKSGGGTASGSITDDDELPVVAVANASTVEEGDNPNETRNMTFAVSLDNDAKKEVTIPYTLGGTASSGSDYIAHGANPSLTIAVGDGDANIVVAILGDVDAESSETVTVTLGNPTNATLDSQNSSASGTITDNDALPVVAVANASTVEEGDNPNETRNMTFAVSLNNDAKKEVTIPYTLGGTASSGSDYIAHGANPSLTIAVGDDGANIVVAILGDVDAESSETVIVTLGNPTNATLDSQNSSASGTITDNDAPPVVAVANASNVAEGDNPNETRNMTFAVSLSSDAKKTVTIPYTLGGTASSGSDYISHGSSPSIIIGVGDDDANIIVAIRGDVDTESSETVTVTLGSPTNATLSSPGRSASGTIVDNDPVPVVSISNASSVAEGDNFNETRNMTFAVSLSSDAKKTVTIPYTLGGTASSGSDYISHGSSPSIIIGVGDDDANIIVAIRGDVDTESSETVTVTLGSPTNATLSSTGQSASGTIIDNDPVPVVSVSNASLVVEGDDPDVTEDMSFAVSLNAAAKKSVTVPYTLGGTATSGSDYISHGTSPSITIGVGDDEATIEVAIRGDLTPEDDETVTVTLGNPSNASIDTFNRTASGTIVDNGDQLSEVSIADAQPVIEGSTGTGGEMRFLVTLSRETDQELSVSFALGGTATAGKDYESLGNSPSIDIAANTDSGEIVLSLIGDAVDEGDELVEITLTGTSVDDVEIASDSDTATGTIVNDDLPPIQVSVAKIEVVEGDTATYQLSLLESPSESFTVTATASNESVSLDSSSIQFSPTNWREPRSIEITAEKDDDARAMTLLIDHQVTPAKFADISVPSLAIDIVDTDSDGVLVSQSLLELDERRKGSYAVSLSAEPVGNVLVVPVPISAQAVAVSDVLTFTPSNWAEVQEVEVAVLDNGAYVNNLTTISHRVYGPYYETLEHPVVTVSIQNDLEFRVAAAPEIIQLDEGESSAYAVVLSRAPGASVTISATSSSPDVVSVSEPVVFDDTNWFTRQYMSVESIENNLQSDAEVQINHEIAGLEELVGPPPVTVYVRDNDTPELEINELFLIVEEGARSEYEVSLRSPPSGDVTVEASMPEKLNSLVIVTDALLFTPDNWETPQSIQVVANADNVDHGHVRSHVEHNATGGGYDDAPSALLAITVLDDDTKGIEFSTSDIQVFEGETSTYSVNLTSEPVGDVTLTPKVTGDSEFLNSITLTSSLVFDRQNWHLPQQISVESSTISVDGNLNFSIEHETSGGGYDELSFTPLQLSYIDQDVFSVAIHPKMLAIEPGSTASYEIRLTNNPNEDIVIVIEPSMDGVLDVSDSIEFSTDSWNEIKTVEVTVDQYTRLEELETISLNHSIASSSHSGIKIDSVFVTVTDKQRNRVLVSETEIVLQEEDTRDVTLALTAAPTESVSIEPSSSRPGLLSFEPAVIVFSVEDWMMEKTVSIRSNDNDHLGILEETITWRASGDQYFADREPPVSHVTVFDNDSPTVVTDQTKLHINEGGSETVLLSLSHAPNDNVTVAIQIDSDEVSVEPAELLFTTDTWQSNQTVIVSSRDDDTVHQISARLAYMLSGGGYDEASTIDTQIEIIEDDEIGVNIDLPAFIHEGRSHTYAISLKSRPSAPVLITPIVRHEDVEIAENTVEFMPDDWNNPMEVTLDVSHDDDSLSELLKVLHDVDGGAFGALTLPQVHVELIDDDELGVRIKPQTVQLTEGNSGSYGIVLQSQPSGTVVIEATSANEDTLTVSESIEFTSSDWFMEQHFTVTSPENSLEEDAEVSVMHTISGGGYDAIAINDVVVKIENETMAAASPSKLSLANGISATYSFQMQQVPAVDMVLTPNPSVSDVLDISPREAELTLATWNQPIEFTITLSEDRDETESLATLTIAHTLTSQMEGGTELFESIAPVTVYLNSAKERMNVKATTVLRSDGSAVVDMKLPTLPNAPVTIRANPSRLGSFFTPSSILFTPQNSHSVQVLNLKSREDGRLWTVASLSEAMAELTVISEDHRFDGASVELSEVVDSSAAFHVVAGILEPFTALTARSNTDRVMDCIEAALHHREHSEPLQRLPLTARQPLPWLDDSTGTDMLNLQVSERDRLRRPSNTNAEINTRLNDRVTVCSGTSQIAMNTRDELSMSSQGKSGHIGASAWLGEKNLVGIDLGHDSHAIEWQKSSSNMVGTSDFNMSTLSPFIARVGENRTNRVWALASLGKGSLDLASSANIDSVYDLSYKGIGLGGAWQLPSLHSWQLRGQSWFAATDATSLTDRFENVAVENHAVRMSVNGDWRFQLGRGLVLATSLSSGMLNDSSIETTAMENQIGLNLSLPNRGLSAGLQLHSLDTNDDSHQATRMSATLAYGADHCCNSNGPWFNLKIGDAVNAVLVPTNRTSSYQTKLHEHLMLGREAWRLETGWRSKWRFHSIDLKPSIWVSRKLGSPNHDFGLTNTYDAGHGVVFKTRLFSQTQGNTQRELGIQGQLDWSL